MSTRDRIAKHGNKDIEVLRDEFLQLHDIEVLTPTHKKDLLKQQIKDAPRTMLVIKEKRDGALKGRTSADGSKQCSWYNKVDATSLTANADSVIVTSAIDAFERRVARTGSMKGAFLHVHQDDFTVIRFVGE